MVTKRALPLTRAALLAGTVIAVSASCADVPAHFAGESKHFRLFIGDGYDLSQTRGATAEDVLTGLETNWSDTATLLRMPEGRIDYYLLLPHQITDRCGGRIAACQEGRSVYATSTADQHELNHAYMELRSSHRPASFLVEGVADAIGCDDGQAPPQTFNNVSDWRSAVAFTRLEDVYAPGRQFSRYLILTYGVERFLRYYDQAPDTSSVERFAANFAAFWSLDLDTVWAAMQVTQPPWGDTEVLPICPCSLPPWMAPAQPTPIAATPTQPYWTWPALEGDTAVWAGNPGSVVIRDCPRQELATFAAFSVMFARLAGPLYSTLSGASVARGRYVAEVCTEAEVYTLPSDLIARDGGAPVAIAVTRPPGTAASVYLALEAPVPMALASYFWGFGTVSVCPSCDPAGTGCQALAPQPSALPVTGRFYLRWDAPESPWPYTYVYIWASPA
jgi:hypothetical protein